MSDVITIRRDDFREILAEYTSSQYNMASNLIGDVQKTLNEHTVAIEVIKTAAVASKETLDRIEAQTTKTNGRVTTLELAHASERGASRARAAIWGAAVSGAVAILSAYIGKI